MSLQTSNKAILLFNKATLLNNKVALLNIVIYSSKHSKLAISKGLKTL